MKKLIISLLFAVLFTSTAQAQVIIRWGEQNVIPLPAYKLDGTEREEAPTIADGDCTLSKDGTESAPTLTWTDTGNVTKVTLSAADSQFTHGLISCEDADATDTYLAFHVYLSAALSSPDESLDAGCTAPCNTVTLDSGTRSGVDDAYNRMLFVIVAGPGVPKTSCVTDYAQATGIITLEDNFTETPTTSTQYVLAPGACGKQFLRDDSVTAAVIATDALDANAFSAAGLDKVAAWTWRFDNSGIEAASYTGIDTLNLQSPYGMVAKQTNKFAVSGATLTIYKQDNTTTLDTQAVTTSAGADPITGLE